MSDFMISFWFWLEWWLCSLSSSEWSCLSNENVSSTLSVVDVSWIKFSFVLFFEEDFDVLEIRDGGLDNIFSVSFSSNAGWSSSFSEKKFEDEELDRIWLLLFSTKEIVEDELDVFDEDLDRIGLSSFLTKVIVEDELEWLLFLAFDNEFDDWRSSSSAKGLGVRIDSVDLVDDLSSSGFRLVKIGSDEWCGSSFFSKIVDEDWRDETLWSSFVPTRKQIYYFNFRLVLPSDLFDSSISSLFCDNGELNLLELWLVYIEIEIFK